ncbi:hypothetical protein EZI54_21570 [Marinobacter halodurans]|uniref:Uncharacterized protein n=1 Tax=Marinobacter halodurans TaxID=2528979 RepID=A0ABY1ZH26_9GAMM|nr:hypothetical protein [Marinobacter halodurans]TBW48228.1 hypothetical protein EZI54_21570 [Marinobacter halodurans]
MQDILQDYSFVRLIKEQLSPKHTVYRIELDGEGTLYSSESLHAAAHYMDMLLYPLLTESAA